MKGRDNPCGFAQPALGAVANHGATDTPRRGEADTDQRGVVTAVARLRHDRPAGAVVAFGGGLEIWTFLETDYGR
jgi:hypothetical protein